MQGKRSGSTTMASDADWVEDVRRWYRTSAQAAASMRTPASDRRDSDLAALGYEAAHPALQARNWPEEQATGFDPLR